MDAQTVDSLELAWVDETADWKESCWAAEKVSSWVLKLGCLKVPWWVSLTDSLTAYMKVALMVHLKVDYLAVEMVG